MTRSTPSQTAATPNTTAHITVAMRPGHFDSPWCSSQSARVLRLDGFGVGLKRKRSKDIAGVYGTQAQRSSEAPTNPCDSVQEAA